MPHRWGPYFITPSESVTRYTGKVFLREHLDEELLARELDELGISGNIEKVVNPWYYRKKNDVSWIKIGESELDTEDYSVRWDTAGLENGEYQLRGLMHVYINDDLGDHVIAGETTVNIIVHNMC